MKFLLLLLLTVSPAYAQVIEVDGGTSTLYDSSGGTVTLHLPDQTMYASAGNADGHFGLGFADVREWRGWTVTLGDKAFGSSVGGAGLSFVTRGVSMSRKGLTLFVGGTGQTYAAPYFATGSLQHIGAGLFYHRDFARGLEFNSLEALAAGQRTGIESLGFHWRGLRLSGAAGVLQNARYWNASFAFQPTKWAGISAARTTYSFATVNSVGGSARFGLLTVNASAFSSKTTGETAGAGIRLGFTDFRADYFHSAYGSSLAGNVGEHLGRHFTVSQFLSESQGHYSVNFGGGYVSNRLSFTVGYATYFMPLYVGRSPFQRAMQLQISFRMPHDTAVNLSTNVDPTGKLRYGAYASSFVYTTLQNEPHRNSIRHGFTIRGTVTDEDGRPVCGAAVQIGSETAYSDSSGLFTVRVKHNAAEKLTVAVDQFSAPGEWEIVRSDTSAVPGTDVTVIVRRK